jgi:hypothetical protein
MVISNGKTGLHTEARLAMLQALMLAVMQLLPHCWLCSGYNIAKQVCSAQLFSYMQASHAVRYRLESGHITPQWLTDRGLSQEFILNSGKDVPPEGSVLVQVRCKCKHG